MQKYSLDDAVLASNYSSYFTFRLRYFLIITLFMLAINGLDFFLISRSFGQNLIAQIILMRLITSLILGGWWGALENLREYVRGRFHFQDNPSINKSIASWLTLSLICSLIIALGLSPYFLSQASSIQSEDRIIFYLYLLAFYIHLIGSFWTTTYHAGAYAIKRIYRPLSWILSIGGISLGLVWILWELLGGIGLPIAFIIGELLQITSRFYFVHQTYGHLNLNPIFFPTWPQIKDSLSKYHFITILQTFVAGICLYLDNILLIIFFSSLKTMSALLIYLYMLKQIYHGYSHWGFLFYYDFKKMRSGIYPPFYEKFLKKLIILSLILSCFFYAIALIITLIFYQNYFFTYSAYVGIFFLFTALMTFIQVHAFSQNRYNDLIFASMSGVFFFLVFQSIFQIPSSDAIALMFLILVITFFLRHQRFSANQSIDSIKKQSIYNLVLHLSNNSHQPKLFKMHWIEFYGSYRNKMRNGFLSQMADNLSSSSWICSIKNDQIVVIEPENKRELTPINLALYSAGMIKSYQTTVEKSSQDCLRVIYQKISQNIRSNFFYQETQLDPNSVAYSVWISTVDQVFQCHFPLEEIIHLSDHDETQGLSLKFDKGIVMMAIKQFFHTPLSMKRKLPYLAAILFSDHPKIYVIRKTALNMNRVVEWNEFIHFLNFKKFEEINFNWRP